MPYVDGPALTFSSHADDIMTRYGIPSTPQFQLYNSKWRINMISEMPLVNGSNMSTYPNVGVPKPARRVLFRAKPLIGLIVFPKPIAVDQHHLPGTHNPHILTTRPTWSEHLPQNEAGRSLNSAGRNTAYGVPSSIF